jgi:hypothetical protein
VQLVGFGLITTDAAGNADYMSHVKEGDREMLWFERRTGGASEPTSLVEVLDAVDLSLPAPTAPERLR